MSNPDLRDLLKRSLLRIEELEASLEQQSSAQAEPIAIIGLGCRFPGGGADPQSYWASLMRGVDAIREVPSDRWPVGFPRPTQPAARWAGLLDQVDRFDAEFFQISPREAMSMDPQQRLLLEVAWEAMEDAGQLPEQLSGSRTGVFVGIMNLDYKEQFIVGDPKLLDIYCFLGNGLSEAAGRLSYILGLQGPCLAVDTACSSSLVAIHLACQSLRSGESSLALAGGVHLILSPLMMEMMARTQGLSPDGRCKTFDSRANGMVRAEGCGVVALKRLSEARRDGDLIRAVIRGSAVNQDGRSSGFTVPNVLSQESLLRQALASAGVAPAQVSYVEAHGTGTPLGDPIEMEALKRVLGEARPDGSECAVSSVKTNLGHLEAAAGVAGFIKTVLALQHQRIPRHLNFQTLNPRISLAGTSLVIPVEERAWTAVQASRIAGVSSFGVSGINAHAVLEEAPPPHPVAATPRAQVLTLTGKSEAALTEMVEKYVRFLEPADGSAEPTVAAIAYTASARRSHHPYRLAVVGKTQKEWLSALRQHSRGESAPGLTRGRAVTGSPPKLVFIFSGHGSQWFGMAQELLTAEPVFRAALMACDAAIQREIGLSVLSELTAGDGRLWASRVDIIQPVLFSLQVALTEQWRSWGIVPDAVVGTSMGEVAAAHVCGALSLEAAVRVICRRSRLIQTMSGKGAMAAVELSSIEAAKLIEKQAGRLGIAASNGPRSTILSGDPQAVEEVLATAEREGIFCRRLQGATAASHSPQMDALQGELLAGLDSIRSAAPTICLYSTVTTDEVTTAQLDGAYWYRNMRDPVMLWPTIERLHEKGYDSFVELSPHPVLVPALQEGLLQTGTKKSGVLGTLRRAQSEQRSMLETLAELYVRGHRVEWIRLFSEGRECVALPNYAWQRQRYWTAEHSAGERTASERRARSRSSADHPLLGERVYVSTQPSSHFWQQRLHGLDLPYLLEHRVSGKGIFPGSGYIEIALAAAKQLRPDREVTLEKVRLERMMVLTPEEDYLIQTVLTPEDIDQAELHISGFHQGQWVRHARLTLLWRQHGLDRKPPSEPLAAVRQRCAIHRTKPQHYQRVRELGGDYGPSFQGVQELWLSENEVLARVAVSEQIALQLDSYQLHPAWLDACLHCYLSARSLTGSDPFLPVSIEQLCAYGTTREPVWVHARVIRVEDTLRVELSARTDDGQPVLRVRGLMAQRLPEGEGLGSTEVHLPAALYEVQWKKQAAAVLPVPGNLPARDNQGTWLLFADRSATSAMVSGALRRGGARCIEVMAGQRHVRLATDRYELDPADPDGYDALLAGAVDKMKGCRGIVHLWSLDTTLVEQLAPESLEYDQQLGCRSALNLVQALARSGWRDRPRLWFVTRGSQAVVAEDTAIALSQAPLWGLAQCIALEHPDLTCTRIDLSTAATTAEAEGLIREIQSRAQEEQVALRGGERYVARLTRSLPRPPAQREQSISLERGAYLISGGLTGLGLAAAQWMAAQGARFLVLLGRSEPGDSARQVIERLSTAGVQVMTAQVDISKYEEARALLSRFGEQWPSLHGVLHSAAVLDDGIILEQTWERFRRVMAPKMHGAWNLHMLTLDQPLDFFVCYSSAMSMLGSPGQSNYVAANAFLDSLAHYRQRIGRCALSINWGVFSQGLTANRWVKIVQRLSDQGMEPMAPEEAQLMLRGLLAGGKPQIGVMKLNPRRWASFFPKMTRSTYWSEIFGDPEKSKQESSSRSPDWLSALLAVNLEERRALLEQLLREQVGQVLRQQAARIDPEVPFINLGFDSLMAVELRNQLDLELQVTVPIVFLLKEATIVRLSAYIIERLQVEDSSSEDQIEEGSV